jgi:hypothetical protein
MDPILFISFEVVILNVVEDPLCVARQRRKDGLCFGGKAEGPEAGRN